MRTACISICMVQFTEFTLCCSPNVQIKTSSAAVCTATSKYRCYSPKTVLFRQLQYYVTVLFVIILAIIIGHSQNILLITACETKQYAQRC